MRTRHIFCPCRVAFQGFWQCRCDVARIVVDHFVSIGRSRAPPVKGIVVVGRLPQQQQSTESPEIYKRPWPLNELIPTRPQDGHTSRWLARGQARQTKGWSCDWEVKGKSAFQGSEDPPCNGWKCSAAPHRQACQRKTDPSLLPKCCRKLTEKAGLRKPIMPVGRRAPSRSTLPHLGTPPRRH